jgi:hypothetical protein
MTEDSEDDVLAIASRFRGGPDATAMNDRHILRRRSVSELWVPHDDLSLWWM